jgi:ABC-type transport system involved in cytochrome bd biosynthesis fused ATPase/permease subunit
MNTQIPKMTQIPENYYRILARERSHEEARQTVATNRMLVQSLVIINGVAAVAVLAYCAARSPSGGARAAAVLCVVLYCLGVFNAIFAGLYVRRTTQEWSSFWELNCCVEKAERENLMKRHRQQAIKSKRWSTGLLVSSEVFFLAASLSLAISL